MTEAVSTITVLFTDQVDSTGLLRHGSDVANQLRRRHDRAIADALVKNRGVVVKSMGDGVMATFASVSDAVSAAVAIQQAIDLVRQGDERMPLVRVGVAIGEASAEDGDWYGPPVIEASRLCGSAAGGQILVSSIVATLASAHREHPFTALEPRLLKGFEGRVPLSEVTWPRLAREALPAPVTSALESSAPFVGRGTELDQLQQTWKNAGAGARAIVLVAGEPGVGKTRLLGELARSAAAEGATVLWGRCDEDPVIPYQPFVEQVRQWLATDGEQALPAALERLLPETSSRLAFPEFNPTIDGAAERLRLFDGVTRFLRGAAANGPLLLVFDDLHWAATPTLLLLRHALGALTGQRTMVVGAYRDTELGRSHPFAAVLADLRREDGVVRIALDGIDTASVAEYLERVAGHALDDDGLELARVVRADTKGNPFFIGQVLRHLVESGELEQDGGRWSTISSLETLGVPEGVREVVGRRLSALSDVANEGLRVAAVVGPEFSFTTLAAVLDAGDSAERLLDALDECIAGRLIRDVADGSDHYEFVHALVRHTLLAELSVARRARLHRRIGDALAAGGAEPAVLAHHYCAGAAAGAVKDALIASVAAADAALRSWAAEEALSIVERALQVSALGNEHHPSELASLYLLEARAFAALSQSPQVKEAAMQAANEARLAGDAVALGMAAIARGGWPNVGVSDPVALQLFADALDALGDDQPGTRSRVLAMSAFYRASSEGEGVEVKPLLDEALVLARSAGDKFAVLECLVGMVALFTGHHDLDLQRRLVAEIENLVGDNPYAVEYANSVHMVERQLVNICTQAGDIDGARAAMARALTINEAHHNRSGFNAMWSGALALMEGRLDDAEAHNDDLAEFANEPNFANSWGAQLFALRREQSRVAELVPMIDGLVASTPGLVAMRALLAVAVLDCGHADQARTILLELAPDGFAAIPHDATWSTSLAYLTEVATVLTETNAAGALRAQLLPFSGQLLVMAWVVSCLGAADRYIAMLDAVLGDRDAAATRFDAAVALEERAGATALAARTRAWRRRLLGSTR